MNCINCSNEKNLFKRYDTEISEYWCEPCVSNASLGLLNGCVPEFIHALHKRMWNRRMRNIPWQKRLLHWIQIATTVYNAYGERKSYRSEKMFSLARWHTYRYKLMYEPTSDKLVFLGGIEFIVSDGKLIKKGI